MTAPEAIGPTTGVSQKRLESPISSLTAIYSAVVTTSLLSEEERAAAPEALHARCAVCGASVGATELQQVAVPLGAIKNPAADSLREARCLTAGCKSEWYCIQLQPDSERHWIRIKERLTQTAPEARELKIDTDQPSRLVDKRRWMLLAACVLTSVIAFFILRYWIYGSPIPLIHKPQEYRFIQSTEEEARLHP